MKKKYAFLLAWFVGLIITSTTCTNELWFKKITYEGALYDTIGGHPVSGVWISLDACTDGPKTMCTMYHVGQNITDTAGHFVIHNNAARSGQYFITIQLPNYGRYNYSGLGEAELNQNYKILYLKR